VLTGEDCKIFDFAALLKRADRRMPHLTGDVAEGVWKNTLLSKVFRLEAGENCEEF
jgi:hypothetical protein